MAATGRKLTAAVEEYLAELRRIRATGGGTGELSYYPPLSNLLNAVGGSLRPKVHCVSQLAQQGAGHPDFGLYASRQVSKGQPKQGQTPEGRRGGGQARQRRRLAHRRQRPSQRLLGALPSRAGHQHPRLRAARRGLARSTHQAGDLPAGRLRRRLRGQAATPPRLRQQRRPGAGRVPGPRPVPPGHAGRTP